MDVTQYDYEGGVPPGFYDKVYERRIGVRFAWHDQKFAAVAARLGRTRRLLDIGCGPGTFIGNYAPGIEAIGTDLSPSQIAYANGKYASPIHQFTTRTVGDLRRAGERFDTVTIIEVIEHIAEADAIDLLTEVRQVLADDGTLILTTPNYGSLWPVIEWGVNLVSKVSYEEQHINRYRRGRLGAHLAKAGYRDVEVGTTVGLSPFAAAVGSTVAEGLNRLERKVKYLGCGNLLIATARR